MQQPLRHLIAAVAVVACAAGIDAQTRAPEANARVELNIFSGRSNPEWQLTYAETARLSKLLAELASTSSDSFEDGLGFRGFQVSLNDGSGSDKITVHNGKLRRGDGGEARWFTDADRKIERLLLASGKVHLDAGVYEIVRKELESPSVK